MNQLPGFLARAQCLGEGRGNTDTQNLARSQEKLAKENSLHHLYVLVCAFLNVNFLSFSFPFYTRLSQSEEQWPAARDLVSILEKILVP